MGKKTAIWILSFLSVISFAFGLGSCGKTGGVGEQKAYVQGFEIKESLNVSVGTVVELEQPIVTDAKGVLLDCWTYVMDANGNYVYTSANSFTADNVGVYTIVYVVRDSENNTYEKRTTLNVTGEKQQEEVTIDVDFEQFIVTGETVTIDASCSDADAQLVYSVKKSATGADVAVDGNTFTPQENGVYKITVSVANRESEAYTYSVFAEAAAKDGEVEVFGDAWAEKEAFVGGFRRDWEIVSSEDCGIVDPYGRESNFAKYSTDRAYIPLYINIRQDVDYYKQLAKEGYTHVSMWIYMQSEKPHITISDRDPNGGFYRREGPDLYPGQWTEFSLNLLDGNSSWTRSFTSCYDMYDNQSHFYLQVDNSYEYNPWGGGDNITFYFTDIYAIKSVDIATAENIETTKNVGDTMDVSTLFSADFGLDYIVSHRGEATALEGSNYTFKANGEFMVTAIPKAWDLRGNQSVNLTVSDGYALNSSPVITERAEDSVSVSLSALNASFTTLNGVTPTITDYKVSYNSEEIAVADGEFTATQDGAYTVEIKGEYNDYATYHTVYVDVWSKATKYTVMDTQNMKVLRAWDWGSTSFKSDYTEYTIGGRTDKYVYAESNLGSQSLVIYAKPMYSKAYYEALYAENNALSVRMNLYHIPGKTGHVTNFWSVFSAALVKLTDAEHNNKWLDYSITLEDFISNYDSLNNKYEEKKFATEADGENGSATNAWIYITGGGLSHIVYFNTSVVLEAEEASVALKENATIALDTDNDLSQLLDVTIDGAAGVVNSAEVYFNNEWVALEDCVFHPAWEVEYAFRFTVQSTDGLKHKQVEKTLTVGDGSFTATEDTGFYSVEIGDVFDVSSVLTENYTYKVKLLRSVKGIQTVIAEYDDGTIETDTLVSGAYTVNVYASKGDGSFGEILYYTLTLDVWSEETKYAVIDVNNMRTIRAWDWDNSNTKAQYGEYTVGGRTSNFIEMTAQGQSLVFYAKPLFSKGYYENLKTQYANMKLLISIYFIPNVTEKDNNFRSIYNPSKSEWFDKYNNQWQTYEMAIADFITLYDEVDGKYAQYANASYGADTDGYEGSWIQLIGSHIGRTLYMNVTIAEEATQASVSLKEGATIALDTDNDLSQLLDFTIDGVAGEVNSAEVYFNDEWVVLEDCIFNPTWATSHIFRFHVQTMDGTKYKQVEATLAVGDGSVVVTKDTDAYILKTGESFDIATLLTEDYTYEIETYKSYGGTLTAVNVLDGTVMKAENLEIGAYFVKVYATNGDETFDRLLYYTLFVDYVDDETALMGAFTADNYKTLFKSYQYSSNQYMTDTIVTTECPTGNSGTFLKYEGNPNNRKEAMAYAFKPLYSSSYYAALAESGNYTVKFDVWIENVNADCARTQGYIYTWNKAGNSFTTHGTYLALGEWHTVEIPLSTLVKNMANGEFRFFGIYIPYGGFKTSDLVRMYMGNFELVENTNA